MCENNAIQKKSTEKNGTSDLFNMHDLKKPLNDQKT